jgi:hypothetical protein
MRVFERRTGDDEIPVRVLLLLNEVVKKQDPVFRRMEGVGKVVGC